MSAFQWKMLAATFLIAASSACGPGGGPCKDDYDCDGTEVCNQETGECEPFVCKADADCLDPTLQCLNNRCVPRK